MTNERLTNGSGHTAQGPLRFERRISSEPRECCAVIRELVQYLQKLEWSESEVFGIHLSLEEAVANAIHHGNALDPQKSVHITLEITPQTFFARVTDEGCGFNPTAIPDPTTTENREQPCGRGLMLMRCYMDRVTYGPAGNSVELFKQRST